MYKFFMGAIMLFTFFQAISQSAVKGNLIDQNTRLPVDGATITLMPANISQITDARGMFSFRGKYDTAAFLIVNNIGYASQTFSIADVKNNHTLAISQKQIQLQDVVIVANAGDQYKPISKADIAMRGVNNSQEVLRIIPGIVIGQHQGGGKAEQIFCVDLIAIMELILGWMLMECPSIWFLMHMVRALLTAIL